MKWPLDPIVGTVVGVIAGPFVLWGVFLGLGVIPFFQRQ